MTPLNRKLVDIIRRDGPISVERYMTLCLGDPEHGYYMTRDPLGARGDFTTAPEISQMFGELIGVWIASAWLLMDKPPVVHLVELGPGRGTLMKDALRAMRAGAGLIESLRVHLVETSPTLREKQRDMLRGETVPITWHDDFDSVPEGPLILVANEFFDALPIRQFVRTQDGWRERMVSCDADGALVLALAGESEATIADDAADGALSSLNAAFPRHGRPWAGHPRIVAPEEEVVDARPKAGHDGSVIGDAETVRETSPASVQVIQSIATRLAAYAGAALVVDYGHASSGFGDSLQAVKTHRFVDALESPGEADLTAHVDFTALLDAARAAGCATQGPASQADFLRAMGIEARAQSLSARATPEQRNAIAVALARLTDSRAATGMGALFKAIALCSPTLPPMPGFDQESP